MGVNFMRRRERLGDNIVVLPGCGEGRSLSDAAAASVVFVVDVVMSE